MADKEKVQRIVRWGTLLAVFCIYFSLSCRLPITKAPDEIMRYDVASYILEHHRLPAGSDEGLRNELWGFSYAFTPYLPSLLASGIMTIVSVFKNDFVTLLTAARFLNVVAATGCVWLGFKIGKKLFAKFENQLLYAVLIGFLPQFTFLASYHNNDIFAIFTSMLILYGWLYGKERHWNIPSCIFLGVGISLCALTYYNAYAWILCSIIYYFGTVIQDKCIENKKKYLLKHGLIITFMVFMLAGWFFIRNAMLYEGDFLGLNAQKSCGELYAIDALKPSNRPTWANQGKTVLNMLFETEWISYSVKSFFACFGALDIWVSAKYYVCYGFVMGIAGVGFLCKVIKNKGRSGNMLLYVCLAICIITPVILSAYNSYSSDYQAQGRYFMPALPALMLCVVKGYQFIDDGLEKQRRGTAIAAGALWILCFVLIFIEVMVPQLYIGIMK